MPDYRPPKHDRDPDLETPVLTPGLAIWLTLSGAFFSWFVAMLLAAIQPDHPPPAVLGIGMLVGFGAAFALARPFIEDPPGQALGFVRAPLHTWAAALLLIPSILVLSELENVVATAFPRPELPALPPPPEGELLRLAQLGIVLVIVDPLVSELFLRGLIQPRMEPHWGSRGAVLGVAMLTTLASVPFIIYPGQLVLAFGVALLLSLLRRAAGSILPGLLLSMGYGTLQILASRELFGIEGFDRGENTHTPLSVLTVPAMLMGIALALCRKPARSAIEAGDGCSDTSDFREH